MLNQETEIALPHSNNQFHDLKHKWSIWAHLPHDTDWSINSYKKIYTASNVEELIAITETLPDVLIKNCMLFMMKDGVNPMWEDPSNRNGGCFSYKISNKVVCDVWKQLSYVTAGGTISNQSSFVTNVTGITISPKKNFCIVKIWMSTCVNQNPSIVTNDVRGLSDYGCLFKKHTPL
jgi:translation initiation factor 4E